MAERLNLKAAQNPAVVLFNARGDYVLNLPAIRALSHLFGDRLTVICWPGMRQTFFPNLALRATCEPPIHYDRGHVFDAADVVDAVAPVDLLLSLNPWHSHRIDELLARLSPRWSVGYYDTFDYRIELDLGKHNIDLNFDVPKLIDHTLLVEDFAYPIDLPEGPVRFARAMRSAVPPEYRVLAIHAETKPHKMWPAERFSTVLDWVLRRFPHLIVLDFGIEDASLDYGCFTGRVVPCRKLSLAAAMALLGTADFFLGVDSCFLHAADLFRIPGVGLFGPSDPGQFGFRFAPHRHLYGGGRMDAITAGSVIEAFESLAREVTSGEGGASAPGPARPGMRMTDLSV